MTINIKNKTILAAAIVLFAAPVFSQKEKEIPTESVEVTRIFDARLLETNKVDVTPLLPALDTSTKIQNYTVTPRLLTVGYDAPILRPVGMKAAKKEKIYNGWFKLGAGIPTSLLGEGGYYFAQKDKFDGKISVRHHSANAKSVENQRFMDNNLSLSGNYYVNPNTAVEGKIGYNFDRVHFYGYPDSLEFTEPAVRQEFRMPEISLRLFNAERTSTDLNYSIAPKVYFLKDFYSNKENGLELNMSATKWFAEKHPFRMNIKTDFTSFRDTGKQNINNIYLQPSFTFHADFAKIKVGGNFASNRDVWSIFPDAEVVLRVWGDGIQVFGGATGDLRKNSFRSLTEYNPFLQIRGSKLKNTKWQNYYGGVKGNLGWLDYSGQIGYGTAKDLALFQTLFEAGQPTRFKVIYDTVKIYNLQGSIKLTPIKNLTLSGTLSQSVFTPSNEDAAWGLPGLEGNFTGRYALLGGKAAAQADVYIANRISRTDVENISGKDNALVDLSIGGSYNFTENIGAFLNINNLLNNKRQRWHDYPTFGMNVMVGVQGKF